MNICLPVVAYGVFTSAASCGSDIVSRLQSKDTPELLDNWRICWEALTKPLRSKRHCIYSGQKSYVVLGRYLIRIKPPGASYIKLLALRIVGFIQPCKLVSPKLGLLEQLRELLWGDNFVRLRLVKPVLTLILQWDTDIFPSRSPYSSNDVKVEAEGRSINNHTAIPLNSISITQHTI